MKTISRFIVLKIVCSFFIFAFGGVTFAQTRDTIIVDCEQENIFDNGDNCNWPISQTGSRCCCWCPDPTGAHAWGHVLDLGKVVSNVDLNFEIRPGAGDAGCVTTGYMYYSLDGSSWSLFWSQPNLQGWTTYTDSVHITDAFRYVRGNTDGCSVDYLKVETEAEVCSCATDGCLKGCISGLVEDANTGLPLAGKLVKLKRMFPKGSGMTLMNVVTDTGGCYSFSNLNDGTYMITVTGCGGGGKKVVVISGGSKEEGKNFKCK